jgi:protocatechuate 3,4-dioxygenase beta subunit
MNHEPEEHDRGLAYDLSTLVQRRHVLKLLGGAALLTLTACRSNDDEASAPTTAAGPTTTAGGAATTSGGTTPATDADSCTTIPEETAGPFPGDGSNGPDILTESGVVRSDIRSSIGSAGGVAAGVTLTVDLTVADTANGCAPMQGAAVYLWHCDREGRYSMYSDEVTGENYLRGVQETDVDGRASFTTIYPACYSGRWPHIHFEVYPSLDAATSAGDPLATSQLALPEDACTAVYATDGYEASVANLQQVSLDTDMVFSDGVDAQTPTMTGSVDDGYTAALSLAV